MNKKQSIAYVICGFIGAGKTTYVRKLEKETEINEEMFDKYLKYWEPPTVEENILSVT